MMQPLKSVFSRWTSDPSRPSDRDQQAMVSESLMGELDYQIKELERIDREQEQQEKRRLTGVDYSWLVTTPRKGYEIPQLERLDLEGLCYRVKPSESGKVLMLFRDSLLNEPKYFDLPRILRACINQVLEQRPKEETLTDWVTKRSQSLGNLRIRPNTRVSPSNFQDPESQIPETGGNVETVRSISLPACVATDQGNVENVRTISLPACVTTNPGQDIQSLPV